MGKLFQMTDFKKPTFSMKVKDTKATIVMYGQIGESFWEESVTAKDVIKEIRDMSDSVKEIEVRLNSPGGSVFDGVSIYEALKQHKAKVTVFVDGLAASIASIIALAGDEIVVGEGAFFMIHQPMAGTFGNRAELERMIDILDRIEAQMVGIYHRKTKLSHAEITKMLSKDTWMSAEEAVDMGFADKISESGTEMRVAASMLKDCPWIKSQMPESNLNKVNQFKINNLANDIKDFLARSNTQPKA